MTPPTSLTRDALALPRDSLAFPRDGCQTRDFLLALQRRGALSEIDRHFGLCLMNLAPDETPSVIVAAALTSRAVQAGHVCLDLSHLVRSELVLSHVEGLPLLDDADQQVHVRWPAIDEWERELRSSKLVLFNQTSADAPTDEPRPLWLDPNGRVYLQRYGDYQRRLVAGLLQLARSVPVDEATLAAGLDRYFPERASNRHFDAQAFAAVLAAQSGLTVISGGPGTGKTTTVARLLLLLQEQRRVHGLPPLRISLLAPTGKAAQRLSESLEANLTQLGVDEITARALPAAAATIHRALGYNPRTPTRFRHHAARPLSTDLVVVDEASMVDLALMTKLVEAVPRGARLVLLGDKDQLASVEAGAIFGDIFNGESNRRHSAQLLALCERVGLNLAAHAAPSASPAEAPLLDRTVHLQRSYRYRDDGGIGKLAAAIRHGNIDAVLSALGEGNEARWTRTDDPAGAGALTAIGRAIAEGYHDFFTATDPEERLAALSRFRVLCAHRRGNLGVEGINRLVEQSLPRAHEGGGAYDGRPIMITQNDYQLGLFNGDIGVLCKDDSRLVACFESTGGLRRVQLSRLPGHETVFAMTVHKSQGSEFEHVALVLPERTSPVFTRELLYTGITRAKRAVHLFGARAVLTDGVGKPIHRSSGLVDALWG